MPDVRKTVAAGGDVFTMVLNPPCMEAFFIWSKGLELTTPAKTQQFHHQI